MTVRQLKWFKKPGSGRKLGNLVKTLAVSSIMVGMLTLSATAKTPSGYSLHLGYIGMSMHYKEHITPSDKEYGWLNGVYIKGTRVSQYTSGIGRMFTSAKISFVNGEITYDGATQSGTPLKSTTKEYIFNFKDSLGFIQDPSKKTETKEYILVGIRIWQRNMQGTGGYGEDYHWLYVGLGAGFNYSFTKALGAGIDAEGMMAPISNSIFRGMSTDLGQTSGEIYNFTLGGVWGYRISAPVTLSPGKWLAIHLTPFYTHWHISESDSKYVTISGNQYLAYEPSSDTNNYGISADITFTF